jgi:AcrR family transcriptional regulator
MGDVKQAPRIPYRQMQALETRRRLTLAARRLFAERGYGATSIEAIAAEVGVAVRTVYAAFGSKRAILAAVCEEWLTEAEVRPLMEEAAAEGDARRAVGLLARLSRQQWERGVDVIGILQSASTADAEVERMLGGWKRDRSAALAGVIEAMGNRLIPGLDLDAAGAIVAALSAAEVYLELVVGGGWSPDRYESWLADLMRAQLVASDPTR